MSAAPIGLTRISDRELEDLLRALHRGALRFPIRLSDLLASGFGRVAEHAEIVAGLDEVALRALLVAVIAERRSAARDRERELERAPGD